NTGSREKFARALCKHAVCPNAETGQLLGPLLDLRAGQTRRRLAQRFCGSLLAILDRLERRRISYDRAFADQADEKVGAGGNFERIARAGETGKLFDNLSVDAVQRVEKRIDLSTQIRALGYCLLQRR